jgi:ABC-type branched-subunit amino acid transport system substrate-binding protein
MKPIKIITILLLSSLTISCGSKPFRIGASKSEIAPKEEVVKKEVKDVSKIALLVPLSGPNQNIGKAMLESAKLAVETINADHIKVIYYDTENKTSSINQAIDEAAAQGAKFIIGPLFSKETQEAIQVVRQHNIKMLSFSNNKKQLSGIGIYLFGFMVDEQVKRVIKYSIDQGYKEFSALLPSTQYGKLIAEEIRTYLIDHDLALTALEFYHNDKESIKHAATSVAIALKNAEKTEESSKKALFIMDDIERLKKVVNELKSNGISKDNVRLLSNAQLEDTTSNIEFLEGAWFAGARNEQHYHYEQQFKKKFGYKPPRIATLSYDAVALVSSLLVEQDIDAELTNPRGFIGIDGIFRFNNKGVVERELSVLEVAKDGFEVVEAAKQAFDTD